MKSVLNWIKSNLVIVILAVVMVVTLPALLFLSGRMNAKLRADVQKQVDDDWRAIQQVSVNYRVPTLSASASPVEFTRPPNAPTTEHIKKVLDELKGQSARIVEAAVQRNKAGKEPMLPGLFPAPEPGADTRLRQQASEAWVEAHRELLRAARAGTPPDPETVFGQLQTAQSQLQQRLGDSEEAQQQVRRELSETRLNIYKMRAADLWFYAAPTVFAGVDPWKQTSLPTLAQIWDWQHRLWIHADIIRAIVKANSNPVNGAPLTVPDAPVKRVESIRVAPWDFEASASSSASRSRPEGRAGGPNYEASITGRAGWPLSPNAMYDVRYAEIDLVVASEEIPRIIDAFSTTNFMSVLDLQLESFDGDAAVALGYYFGPRGLVRARLTIETLWLRSWMTELMPEAVKQAIGLGRPAREANEEMEQ